MSDEQQPGQPGQPIEPHQPIEPVVPPSLPGEQRQAPQTQQSDAVQPPAPPQPEWPAAYQQVTPQQVSDQQWIPVAPPPHPYTAGQAQQASTAGKILAIASMALGLAALLTLGVSVAYFNLIMAVVGGVIGSAALIVGIIALVKKGRPLGAAITGVGTGALSIISVTVIMALGSILIANTQPTPVAPGANAENGETWSPSTPQESLLDWPANMATGGIVFEGPGDPRPVTSDPLQAGTAPQPNQIDRENRNDILVYVDYRCPHCLAFEQENSKLLESMISQGKTTVEFVPLSFMDRISEGSYYSSRAVGAVACFADLQPEATWAAHSTLLRPDVQPGAGTGLDNAALMRALDAGVGAISEQVADCISTERFVPFAQGLNEWVFQNAVPNTVAQNVRVEGTPLIVVNGVVYPGDPSDPAEFKAFVEEQTN